VSAITIISFPQPTHWKQQLEIASSQLMQSSMRIVNFGLIARFATIIGVFPQSPHKLAPR
jgi:hypothetical protein